MSEKLIPTWKERLAHLDKPTDFAEAQAAKMEAAELRRYIRELESASQPGGGEADRRDAEAYRRINTPEIADFLSAVHNEALHQRERWGAQGDAGKTDADWFWLLGYLGGKAMRAETVEKVLHHIITTAAACLNWHAARVGHYVDMRPGIAAPSAGNGGAEGE